MSVLRCAAVAILLSAAPARAQDQGAVDRAFDAYWSADSPKAAARAGEGIIAAGASFDEVYRRLAAGRVYPRPAKTETTWNTLPGGGANHPTEVILPKDYDPKLRYPVRVYLHGGVARPDPRDGDDPFGSAATGRPPRPRRRLEFSNRYIAVYPSGYADAMWWFENQMTNFAVILDRLKRNYNVDENRVHLMGVSDGGTGAFFVGLKDPTPWSSFFPLNGFLRVLANPATRADGDLFTANLAARPLYVVNGEMDPLYPVIAAFPYMVMLKRAGADLTFRPMPGAGHDTSWWKQESPAIDAFEERHPRDPYPTSLSWETERTDRYNRLAWLVIDRLDPAKGDAVFADENTIEIQEAADFGLRVDSRKGDGRKIIDIVDGTTADRMGLRKGDVIARMDETTIRNADDIGRAFDAHTEGTPLVFEVERKGARVRAEGIFPPAPKPPRKEQAFPHARPSGRVAVTRQGNRFEARVRGVSAFTLLLSPAQVDFSKPVTVTVNGRPAFEGTVTPRVETLLRWAARDNDRTTLFGAELPVQVP